MQLADLLDGEDRDRPVDVSLQERVVIGSWAVRLQDSRQVRGDGRRLQSRSQLRYGQPTPLWPGRTIAGRNHQLVVHDESGAVLREQRRAVIDQVGLEEHVAVTPVV